MVSQVVDTWYQALLACHAVVLKWYPTTAVQQYRPANKKNTWDLGHAEIHVWTPS